MAKAHLMGKNTPAVGRFCDGSEQGDALLELDFDSQFGNGRES